MKLRLFTQLSLLCSSLVGVSAFAGGSDGGGGKGVVCYNSDKSIESVELLDFYEGRELEGLNISSISENYMDQYSRNIRKASFGKEARLLYHGKKVVKGFRFLSAGVRLKPIDDSGEIFTPANCKLEQLANFQGMGRIFIVGDFWNKLSETSKAGLLLHEVLWYKDRIAGTVNSKRARRMTAKFFASNYVFYRSDFHSKPGDVYCKAKNLEHTKNNKQLGLSFYMRRAPSGYPHRLGKFTIHYNALNRTGLYEGGYRSISYGGRKSLPLLKSFSSSDQLPPEFLVGIVSPSNLLEFTHELKIKFEVVLVGSEEVVKKYAKVLNLEFPNYDDKFYSELECRLVSDT